MRTIACILLLIAHFCTMITVNGSQASGTSKKTNRLSVPRPKTKPVHSPVSSSDSDSESQSAKESWLPPRKGSDEEKRGTRRDDTDSEEGWPEKYHRSHSPIFSIDLHNHNSDPVPPLHNHHQPAISNSSKSSKKSRTSFQRKRRLRGRTMSAPGDFLRAGKRANARGVFIPFRASGRGQWNHWNTHVHVQVGDNDTAGDGSESASQSVPEVHVNGASSSSP